jgi:lysine 6-dehydrogenase
MKRFLVMGAGKMGTVLAKDLIDSDSQNEVTLVDISFDQLKEASDWIQNERLVPIQRNLEDEKQRDEVFKGQDVALCALLHKHSLNALEASVRNGVHFVDLIGEYSKERLEFDEEAKQKNIVAISGIGVSPGITNVCVGRGVHLLDETDKAFIYVGGNPVEPKPPLKYTFMLSTVSLAFMKEKCLSFRMEK